MHASSNTFLLASSPTLRSTTTSLATTSNTSPTTLSGSSFKPLKTPLNKPLVSRTWDLRRTSEAERNERTRRIRRVRMSGFERALEEVSERRRVLYRREVTCANDASQFLRST